MIERDSRLEPHYASQLHGNKQIKSVDQPLAALKTPVPEAAAITVVDSAEKFSQPRGVHRTAWALSLSAMGLVVGLVIVGIMRFLNGPVTATSAPTLAQVQVSSTPKPSTIQLAGLYFEMTYPALFDQVGRLKNDAQAFEQYNISSKKDYRRVMAVSVRTLPSNLLDDDSSYKFRHISGKDYQERSDRLAGEAVAVMSKTDNSEVTLFWVHQGKLLTISITSSNPNDQVADYMKAVEPTLRWRT